MLLAAIPFSVMERGTWKGPAEGVIIHGESFPESVNPVGILAGGGPLPARLAARIQARGGCVFVIGFAGFAEESLLAPFPHKIVRLAAVGEIFALLRAHHCRDLVLIGPVRRPSWRDLRPDAEGLHILSRLGRAVFGGDDGLLGTIIHILEEEGFVIHGAHDFLDDETGCEGVSGIIGPDAQARADIARGVQVLSVMAALDIGQACVVQNGLVLAVEALEGTDAMLERCKMLKQEGTGGVLVKMPKKGQELRADMPAIGPLTITGVAQAGLGGIAFVAGETLFIQKEICVKEADKCGIFLFGLKKT